MKWRDQLGEGIPNMLGISQYLEKGNRTKPILKRETETGGDGFPPDRLYFSRFRAIPQEKAVSMTALPAID